MIKVRSTNRLGNWKICAGLGLVFLNLCIPSLSFGGSLLQDLVQSAMVRELMIERQDLTQFKDSKQQGKFLDSVFGKVVSELGNPELSHPEKSEILEEMSGILFHPFNHINSLDDVSRLPVEEQKILMEKYQNLSKKEQELIGISGSMKDVSLVKKTDPVDPKINERRKFLQGVTEHCEIALSQETKGVDAIHIQQLKKVFQHVKSQLAKIALTPLDSRIIELDGGAPVNFSNGMDREAFARLEASYKKNHLLQELIWLYERSGMKSEADLEKARLHSLLSTSPVRSKSHLGIEGGGDVISVEFENGVKAVFKSEANRKHEISAYVIDQLFSFGMVPMTIEREIDGKMGSLQYFVRDGSTTHNSGVRTPYLYPWIHFVKRPGYPSNLDGMEITNQRYRQLLSPAPAPLVLFDYLVQHGDRWPERKNFVLRTNGQTVAIDHEGIFISGGRVASLVDQIVSNPLSLYPGDRVYAHLQGVSDESIRLALASHASASEIEGLLQRRGIFLKSMAEVSRISEPSAEAIAKQLQKHKNLTGLDQSSPSDEQGIRALTEALDRKPLPLLDLSKH